mmetsp:Transcript_14021/g.37874  ORF Transcript_14021/g.37874 Transcript_14021/m.37874 type:complete len:241 (+) Transcript_14021:1864-2586(+)
MCLFQLGLLNVVLHQRLLNVLTPLALYLLHCGGAEFLLQGFAARLLLSRLKEAGCGLALKRDLFIVVDGALALALLGQLDACGLQLSLLLQRGQPPCLLHLVLTCLSLGLLTLCVSQAGPCLRKHLLLLLIHVHSIRTGGLGFRVGINLSRTQAPGVVRWIVLVLFTDRHIQQPLVSIQALCGRATHDGRNGSPLRGHELGQVQQLFILLTRPLCLLDAGIKPLKPSGLALLRGLANQQG